MLMACSGDKGTPAAEKEKQEEPAEKGAADIERKADGMVKAKVETFEAKARQQQEAVPDIKEPVQQPDEVEKK